VAIVGFDPSVLLNYYATRQPLGVSRGTNAPQTASQTQVPPWDLSIRKPTQQAEDVSARSKDPYFDPKDLSLTAKTGTASNANSQLEALLKSTLSHSSTAADANPTLTNDNNKLFALYKALNRLEYIAQMANRDSTTSGLRPGLDKNFQDGLSQILSFVKTTDFSNLTVMAGQKTSSTQAGVSIAYPKTEYVGGTVAADNKVFDPVAGVTASDSFTISITKGGTTTDVAIDLANVSGPLTIDNIDAYVNQQLQAAGFGSRFSRVQTGGDLTDGTATWGIKIANSPSEKVALSSTAATPAIYVAGSAGKADSQEGKLIKFTDLSGTQASGFSKSIAPDSGTASAKATAVDANGNVYVIGNATGSFGSEINQGSQDVFLSKYDSAGNLQWTKLLGSAGSAGAYGVAVDPSSGGVVIVGSVVGDLSPSAIGSGSDSFVAKYDSEGNQAWVRQVAPASNDRANSVSVDASGNIYIGGQTQTTIGAGQTSAGGTDAYVTKLSKTGTLLYQRQFGTAGMDAAQQTAIADDGGLVVASIQNGHAVLTKYNSADGVSMPVWQIDLGDLQGGTIGGIAAANGRIYLTGTSAAISLDAGGAATIAHPSSGGTDAFVFSAVDAGASATPEFVSYVGTGASDQGGGIAAANGKLYLTGTTTGTFAGETRNEAGTHNLFVTQLSSDGSVDWTHQYGGLDGESQGAAIAADTAGSSVLDALGLPRGAIENNQSNLIESQTTARAGDYFTLKIDDKTGTRKTKITLAKGETLRSLALKINSALLFDGKATALGVKGGQGLKIAVNEGVKVQFIAGSKDFDALAGLGLKPQTLVNDGKTAKDGTTSGPQIIGLGIDGGLSLLSKNDASHAHTVLLAAESLIKQAYTKLNSPAPTATAQATGPAPAYLQNQIAGYQTALAWLNTINGTGG
jgi:hypothetical protein